MSLYTAKQQSELLNRIQQMDSSHHVVIGAILKSSNIVKLNENQSGIMVNFSTIPDSALKEITNYLNYVSAQEQMLSRIETETEEYKQSFFREVTH
jgi:hypothetical protein